MAKYTSELFNNPATRVPICLCLDLSGSMATIESGDTQDTGETEMIDGKMYRIVTGGSTRLDELQLGLELFFHDLRHDDNAVDSAEIAIVGFDSSATCLTDFKHIEDQIIPKLTCQGSTAMGEGVNMALDLLEERKQFYKDNGIQYYQPWLVLMSDGEQNGNPKELQRAIERTTALVKDRKLVIFPVGIGAEADMKTMAKLSPQNSPLRLDGLKFKEFFSWLSQSVSKVSVSEDGKIEVPTITWSIFEK